MYIDRTKTGCPRLLKRWVCGQQSRRIQRHNFWFGDSMNAPLPQNGTLSNGAISLDEKYTLERGRVFITGTQALIRLPMLQHQHDIHAGLNTAGFISGYRGSPLNNNKQTTNKTKPNQKTHQKKKQPGMNED